MGKLSRSETPDFSLAVSNAVLGTQSDVLRLGHRDRDHRISVSKSAEASRSVSAVSADTKAVLISAGDEPVAIRSGMALGHTNLSTNRRLAGLDCSSRGLFFSSLAYYTKSLPCSLPNQK